MDKKGKIHFTGISSPVMFDLAIALKSAGYDVSGSDAAVTDANAKDKLLENGLLPTPGWQPDKLKSDHVAVIIGPSVSGDNPEIHRALELKVPVHSYAEYIYQVCRNKHRVVVTGSHGKTMITLLILHVLRYHNRKFDFVLAKQVPGVKNTVQLTDAPLVIIEGQDGLASTLDPTTIFLKYNHHIGVISGIEWSPSTAFPSKAEYTRQFSLFESNTPKGGVLIYFDLEPVVTALAKVNQPDVLYIPYKTHATTYDGGKEYLVESSTERHPFKLTGKHNLQNISAAKETLKKLGITTAMFYEAIQSFGGETI